MAEVQQTDGAPIVDPQTNHETTETDQFAEVYRTMADLSAIVESARSTLVEIETARDAANQAGFTIESAKKSSAADSARVKEVLTDIQTRASEIQAALPTANESLKNSRETVVQIQELHTQSKTHASGIKNLVPRVEDAAERVEQHQVDLQELKNQIEDLLPGATSAGLAKAFQDQKQRFDWPKRIWGGVFVASIFSLVAIAGYGAGGLLGNETTVVWQSLLAYLLRRLPLAAPLVWLAYFAGRRYMDAERLQVDYGYKEAISTAFEGYKKQMSDLGEELDLTSPIATLCNNQLRSIAEHPGNVYRDGHGRDITLATPIGEFAQHLGAFSKQLSSIPPATPWSEALPKILAALSEVLAKRA